MTREGDIIGPESDRLEVLGVTDLVAYVVHPDDAGKKRPRYIPKVVGRVVHAVQEPGQSTNGVRVDSAVRKHSSPTVVEEW